MIGFKAWVEASTARPVIGIDDSKPKDYQVRDVEGLHTAIKNFCQYVDNNTFDNIQTDADFADLLELITAVAVKVTSYNTASRYKDKKIQLPPNLQGTRDLFAFMKKRIDRLKSVVNKYKHIYRTRGNNENIRMIVHYINGLDKAYADVIHASDAAAGKSGHRFDGDFQQQANQISAEVRNVVLDVVRKGLSQLMHKDQKYKGVVGKAWEVIEKQFSKPLAVSALQKEAVNYDAKTLERVHSEFIKSLGNLASLLQTPKVWRDARYVERVLFETVSSAEHYPPLYQMQEKTPPYKFEQTMKAIRPVIKLLPNIINHFKRDLDLLSNSNMIRHYLGKFFKIWEGLKHAWESTSGSNAMWSQHIPAVQKILPQVKQHIENHLEKYFPNMGRNRNNYLKAINLYINRIHGVLDLI